MKNYEGFWSKVFPWCTFEALVVGDFANCTTTCFPNLLTGRTDKREFSPGENPKIRQGSKYRFFQEIVRRQLEISENRGQKTRAKFFEQT
jgi:hypothetical protein